MQPIFIRFFSHLIIALVILGLSVWFRGQPTRWPGPERTAVGWASEVKVGNGLHAWRLAFTHPVTGEELAFESPLPPDLEAVLAGLS